ncbi:MAG: hypothetical protein ACYYKD_04905 [Rhodospirillales bacterium]
MAEHIKIGEVSPRIHYTADGVQTRFVYPFPIFENADLKVHADAGGAGGAEEKTLDVDYSVEGAGESTGGAAVFKAPPAAGAAVTLRRSVAIKRTADFQESGEFRAKVINDELDAIAAYSQELSAELARVLRLPDADPDAVLRLPAKAARARKVLGFDADGNAAVSALPMDGLDGLAAGAETAVKSASAAGVSETSARQSAASAQAAAQASAASAASNLFARVRRKAAGDSPYDIVHEGDDGALFTVADDGDVVFQLPSIALALEGERYGFLREGDSHAVKLAPHGADTVNGQTADYMMNPVAGEILVVVADDNDPDNRPRNWIVIPWTQASAGDGLVKTGAAIGLDLAAANAWTGPQRTPPVHAPGGVFDMNTGQDFICAPGADAMLSFTNTAPGQRGMIRLENPQGRAVTLAPGVRAEKSAAKSLSKPGTYNLGYWAHGVGVVDITYSGGLI